MAAVRGVPQLDPRERESTPQAPKREVEAGQGKAIQDSIRQKEREGSGESLTACRRVIHVQSFSSLQ
jgi:hypothetical protein